MLNCVHTCIFPEPILAMNKKKKNQNLCFTISISFNTVLFHLMKIFQDDYAKICSTIVASCFRAIPGLMLFLYKWFLNQSCDISQNHSFCFCTVQIIFHKPFPVDAVKWKSSDSVSYFVCRLLTEWRVVSIMEENLIHQKMFGIASISPCMR